MRGLTVYLCFGRYAGFHALKDGDSYRIILGWLSIGLLTFDLEVFLGAVLDVMGDEIAC